MTSKETEELEKSRKHLSLLREEYVKLQQKYCDLEKKYNLLNASKGVVDDNSFVSRLVRNVANLFDRELYSDLTIKLNGNAIKGHKFVLSSRSDGWDQLDHISELDLTHVNPEVAFHVIRWVYTDTIDFQHRNEEFILDVMRSAKRYDLNQLVELCEQTLMTFVNVSNCVQFYQTADEIGAETLKNHCSELVSNHWDDFTSDDFVTMSAPLLYQMFKTKTEFPLHTAVRIKREDVLFLYLMEFDAQLAIKLNETDPSGELPLHLALKTKQEDIAKTLVLHKANVNAVDANGQTLLHWAIDRDDHFSAHFLIKNNASVDTADSIMNNVPLHLCADKANSDGMARIARNLLDSDADPNLQDINGNSPLHRSVMALNKAVFDIMLEQPKLSIDLRNKKHMSSFAISLEKLDDNDWFAQELCRKGCSIDSINPVTSDSLLHSFARNGNENAGLFLTTNGAKINLTNSKGETALHIAAAKGLKQLVSTLLEKGANCNLQTSPLTFVDSMSSPESEQHVFNQTPLHLAIAGKHESIVEVILNYYTDKSSAMKGDLGSTVLMPNLNIKNSKDQTPLSLAIQSGLHMTAQLLINAGASVNIVDANGYSLLHLAIIDGDVQNSLFLLNHGSDIHFKTPDGEHCIQLAVKHQLEPVVEELCAKGSDVNVVDSDKNCLLWNALQLENENIASILVRYQCDTDFWSRAEDGLYETLLHRALDENNEKAACFFIRSGCDINAIRRPGPDGMGQDDVDKQTPLHLASGWGLEEVVYTLMEHMADVNAQDVEGKTGLMIAIVNQHQKIISLLLECRQIDLSLRDNLGNTAFSLCVKYKNNKAANLILMKEPTVADKYDGKGRNYLHIAVEKKDIESVLFLLSIKVKVNSKVKDNTQKTALHLAAESGNDMIVRNLLLADAHIGDVTSAKQTALHLAAEHDHNTICSILLENGVEYEMVDINGNNALHIACQKGNLSTCKVLLAESRISADTLNFKGQNPLHLLATFGRENSAAIFDIFIESMPDYPINKIDGNGNTPLLLAYMNGNGNLCRGLIKSGAILGTCNNEGVNIFNHSVATKNLLYRLLDFLPQEPAWTVADACLECGLKFTLTTRKHHCRHCGRVLCSRCSSKDLPILKFNLTKPVRVCEVCFDVLTLGFNT
ncbi:rabankyrin-5-like [Oppia nitens]|uniref:rabankyrin-5-like n=1 Tax=Oppia nitens TaxID=1686743 RepID=UPI0023DA676B|nr:rabankyrin-5-like [Oppia nitens]